MPWPTFVESARTLDYQRLGKQRAENMQIMKALCIPTYGWQNHPAVNMWRGYEFALLDYQAFICNEWIRNRGYKDSGNYEKTVDILEQNLPEGSSDQDPPWMGDWEFHISHQSNLIRKDPFYYRPQFRPDIPDNLEYVWPKLH